MKIVDDLVINCGEKEGRTNEIERYVTFNWVLDFCLKNPRRYVYRDSFLGESDSNYIARHWDVRLTALKLIDELLNDVRRARAERPKLTGRLSATERWSNNKFLELCEQFKKLFTAFAIDDLRGFNGVMRRCKWALDGCYYSLTAGTFEALSELLRKMNENISPKLPREAQYADCVSEGVSDIGAIVSLSRFLDIHHEYLWESLRDERGMLTLRRNFIGKIYPNDVGKSKVLREFILRKFDAYIDTARGSIPVLNSPPFRYENKTLDDFEVCVSDSRALVKYLAITDEESLVEVLYTCWRFIYSQRFSDVSPPREVCESYWTFLNECVEAGRGLLKECESASKIIE